MVLDFGREREKEIMQWQVVVLWERGRAVSVDSWNMDHDYQFFFKAVGQGRPLMTTVLTGSGFY